MKVKKNTSKLNLKKAVITVITMSIIILCVSLLVAVFIFNKYIGFIVSFVFVILLLISAKLEAQKVEREKRIKKVV